jgi:toxin secretion/phage lysis holin
MRKMTQFVEFLETAKSFLLPGTKVEAQAMCLAAWAAAVLEALVGGFDKAVAALLALVVLDYLTGLAAAAKQRELCSRVGFRGLGKKLAIFAAVAFGQLVDQALGTDLLRDMAVFSYGANEALSILENLDRLGYGEYIPAFMRAKIAAMQAERAAGRRNAR